MLWTLVLTNMVLTVLLAGAAWFTVGRMMRPMRRPAAYVDKLLIEGKGGVHHIWACDHYKTTLNAHKFKQDYKKRTDIVKDAMNAVPAGDKPALVAAIVDAIKKGGLFAVDVDIVPPRSARPATYGCRRLPRGR